MSGRAGERTMREKLVRENWGEVRDVVGVWRRCGEKGERMEWARGGSPKIKIWEILFPMSLRVSQRQKGLRYVEKNVL